MNNLDEITTVAESAIPAKKEDRKIIVLLVDDQEIIAKGIEQMLKNEQDIEFHYIDDPKLAVQKAIDVDATIILQDLVMPDADGMVLLRFYKANPPTKNIPVVIQKKKKKKKT